MNQINKKYLFALLFFSHSWLLAQSLPQLPQTNSKAKLQSHLFALSQDLAKQNLHELNFHDAHHPINKHQNHIQKLQNPPLTNPAFDLGQRKIQETIQQKILQEALFYQNKHLQEHQEKTNLIAF